MTVSRSQAQRAFAPDQQATTCAAIDTSTLLDDPQADPSADDDGALAQNDAWTSRTRTVCVLAVPEDQLVAWLGAIVKGNDRALGALYDATGSRVYGLVLPIVRKPALAQEVVEDTYFQVWRQADRFDAERARVMTWVLNMARSRAIDALRREARFQHESLDTDSGPEIAAELPAHDELLDAARGHADLHRALMKLSAQPRQLLALAFFRGCSHEDISLEVRLPLGTVKSQIRRALISLRHLLGERASSAPTP